MKTRRRKIVAVTLVVLAAAGGTGFWGVSVRHARIRRKWKEQAIADLRQLSVDSDWVREQISTIQGTIQITGDGEGEQTDFFTRNLILMRNGEWIAYSSRCCDQHGHDLFIGTDKSGRWYYTSFHFCKGMMNMEIWGQPESLAAFIEYYHLREFDGLSDECFQKTKSFRED